MNVETVNIDSITLDPANVRKHDERNMSAIKASLKRFGPQWPLAVVDGDGIVRAGNGRIAAARQLGWSEVPIVRTELKGAEAVAFAIADNRTAELAAWDDSALAETLAALQNDDSVNHLATGFTDDEITGLIGEATGLSGDNDGADVMIPEVFQVVADCEGEAEQRRVYELLKQEGITCRISTL